MRSKLSFYKNSIGKNTQVAKLQNFRMLFTVKNQVRYFILMKNFIKSGRKRVNNASVLSDFHRQQLKTSNYIFSLDE
jgi:hypothetical protein